LDWIAGVSSSQQDYDADQQKEKKKRKINLPAFYLISFDIRLNAD